MPKTQPPRPRKVENPRKPFERHVPGIRYGMLDDVVGYAIRRAQIARWACMTARGLPEVPEV